MNAALVFINPRVMVVQPEGELPAFPFVTADKLKDVVRKAGKGKGPTLSNAQINELRAAFENPETLGPVEKSEEPSEPEAIAEAEVEAENSNDV